MQPRNQTSRIILFSGLTAGTLDILSAFLVTIVIIGRSSVEKILQYIASAAIGPEAFKGGWAAAATGLFFHFIIAFIFAAIYYFAMKRIAFLQHQPVISGIIYGILIWCVMNFVVIPLSTLKTGPLSFDKGTILIFLCNVLFVGLPIALISAKMYSGSVRIR